MAPKMIHLMVRWLSILVKASLSVIGALTALIGAAWKISQRRNAWKYVGMVSGAAFTVFIRLAILSAVPGAVLAGLRATARSIREAPRGAHAAIASGGASLLFEYKTDVTPVRSSGRSVLAVVARTGGVGLLFDWPAATAEPKGDQLQ